jgi:hypothetical protein
MNDFLYFCPTCKAIYEIVHHRVRPPMEPVCDGCRQDLPIADDNGDWLTYRRMGRRFEAGGITLSDRRFPPPWTVEELDACFVVLLPLMWLERNARED